MAWSKTSADVGLRGLTEWEAARGVMGHKDFQLMPMPTVEHIKVVSGSILYRIYILGVHSTVYIDHVEEVGDIVCKVFIKVDVNLGGKRR